MMMFSSTIVVESATTTGTREDRVGVRDWIHKSIGFVDACATSTWTPSRWMCASKEGISATSTTDGATRWRRAETDENAEIAFVAFDVSVGKASSKKRMAVVGSGIGGKTLRAYDLLSGELAWEDAAYGDAAPSEDVAAEMATHRDVKGDIDLLFIHGDVDTSDKMVTLTRGEVVMRSKTTGETDWRATIRDEAPNAKWTRVFFGSDGVMVYALGRDRASNAPCAASIRGEDGVIVNVKCASSKYGDVVDDFAVRVGAAGKPVAATATTTGKFVIIDVEALTRGKGVSISAAPTELLPPGADARTIEFHALRGGDASAEAAAKSAGVFTLKSNLGCALGKLNAEKAVAEAVKVFDDGSGACPVMSTVSLFGEDASTAVVGAVFAESVAGSEGEIEYVGSAISILDGASTPLGKTRRGDRFKRAAPLLRAFAARDGFITVDEDATVSFHSSRGVVAWTREEASSQATEVMFGRLPERSIEGMDDAGDAAKLSLYDRAEMQVLSIKARFKRAGRGEMARLVKLRSSDKSKLLAKRDANGFRRSILMLSKRGALVALHNGDGRTLWKRFFGFVNRRRVEFVGLMEWTPVGGDSSVDYALAIADDPDASSTILIVVNQFTGETFGSIREMPIRAAHVLPFTTPNGESGLVLVDSEGVAVAYPDDEEAVRVAAKEAIKRMSYYKVDQESNEVRGYKLFASSSEQQGDDARFESQHAWTVSFPPERGEIVGFASKPMRGETTHSWVHVPGDRSTLFKYLNPNTIFIATSDETALFVSLIDGVTGRILYRVRHGDARGPARAVVYENWVAYHYFNTRAQRYAMSVLEMFDDGEDRRGLAVGSLVYNSIFGAPQNETASSLSPPALRVIGQSYYIRPEAKFLAVTRSKRGITEPAVLIATANDQVTAVDKRFLDPRRPTKPTPADREEGLVPYSEVIPVFPSSWVTHRHTVSRLRGIITTPAELESNVHFLAHGLDVFVTRVAPSASFDALDDDFSHVLLVATLIALLVAVRVVTRLADDAEDDRAWR